MRKSIAQISSQISSDPPGEPYTGAITDPSFVIKIEAETRKEWQGKAEGVIRQAKADTSDIMERYDEAVKIRHPQELNAILTTLHSDLAPHNTAIERLMSEYVVLEKKRYEVLETWSRVAEETGRAAAEVGNGLGVIVQGVIDEDQRAIIAFDQSMGRIKRPRKTDDTVVPSDEE